jgi:hypothetical protein
MELHSKKEGTLYVKIKEETAGSLNLKTNE